jgi:hypothetical protein
MSNPLRTYSAAEVEVLRDRIAALEEDRARLETQARIEAARARALALVLARRESDKQWRRLAMEPEHRCAYGALCIDMSDLLLLLVGVPASLPGAAEMPMENRA